MRVLLIEDNDGDADLVAEALAGSPSGGVQLVRVSTLRAGIDALARGREAVTRFDVVLLDLSLPDAFGLAGLAKLRDASPEMAIVVLTGAVSATIGMEAIRQGAQDFLEKGGEGGRELLRAIRYARERAHVAARARVLSDATAALGSADSPERMLSALGSTLSTGFADWFGGVGADESGVVSIPTRRSSPALAGSAPGRLFASFADAPLDDPDRAQIDDLAARGLGSAIFVPFRAHGWSRGALTFARNAGASAYAAADLALAQEITRRVAAAIDHVGLLEVALRERERAEVASRARDEFLATLSHELRTPLHAILGWTALLRGGSVPAEKLGKGLETIERNARSQAALVEDVLEVSRIITGKIRLEICPVDLGKVVTSAFESIRPAADAKGVSLENAIDPAVGTVPGDPDRMLQVMWNLLSNAVKFTPRGGKVQVRLARDESWLTLVVSDTGQGIAKDLLPHVFERFRQGDSSSTRAHGGLGLGLAIARHLVELQGGTLSAESDGLAKGATFTARLPAAVPAPESVREPAPVPAVLATAPPLAPRALDGLRVLAIDDDEDARWLLAEILESTGAEVTTAPSAKEGLALLREARPDVLLSDIGMPDVNGYELIERVRRLPPTEGGKVPAIAMTAYSRAEDREKAERAGFDLHVAKPFQHDELVASILRLTSRGRGDA